jgi:membrane-associated phospholipid phosphatase
MGTAVANVRSLDCAGAHSSVRTSEIMYLGFLAYAEVASLLVPLANAQRAELLAINTAAAGIILLLARRTRSPGEVRESKPSSRLSAALGTMRDWLPCSLIILAYRESALFSAPQPLHPLNQIFERWDLTLLGNSWVASIRTAASPWLNGYLEFAYLLCYPIVPLGFAVIYSLSRPLDSHMADRTLDRFWTGVLLALLSCYTLFAFFPLVTPRLLFHDFPLLESHLTIRSLNLWLLGQFAGGGGVFPSGHVAGATAVALSVWKESPRWGAIFVIIAASIAIATVLERYHYTADAIAGIFIAVAAVSISSFLFERRPQRPTGRS